MSSDITDTTLEAMDSYGGSFVRTLAALYRRADPENRAILRHAFATVFAQYADLENLRKDLHG